MESNTWLESPEQALPNGATKIHCRGLQGE
jgi:hypothetical protein